MRASAVHSSGGIAIPHGSPESSITEWAAPRSEGTSTIATGASSRNGHSVQPSASSGGSARNRTAPRSQSNCRTWRRAKSQPSRPSNSDCSAAGISRTPQRTPSADHSPKATRHSLVRWMRTSPGRSSPPASLIGTTSRPSLAQAPRWSTETCAPVSSASRTALPSIAARRCTRPCSASIVASSVSAGALGASGGTCAQAIARTRDMAIQGIGRIMGAIGSMLFVPSAGTIRAGVDHPGSSPDRSRVPAADAQVQFGRRHRAEPGPRQGDTLPPARTCPIPCQNRTCTPSPRNS